MASLFWFLFLMMYNTPKNKINSEYILAIKPDNNKTPSTRCKPAKIKRICDALLVKLIGID